MRTFAIFFFIISIVFPAVSFVSAEKLGPENRSPQYGPVNPGSTLVNPLGITDVQEFLLKILGIVTDTIGPVVVILMLVYTGFLFVTAKGKEAEIRAARQALLWTVVGALILLGAKAIALGIQATVAALKV